MINWQLVVLNLRSKLGSIAAIQRASSLDWKHLENLSLGVVAEPRFNSGLKLLALHERVCPDRHRSDIIGTLEISRALWN